MFRTKLLLELLTREIQPGVNQRHNITLNGDGVMEVCLMLGDRFVPFAIEETDFDRPISALAYEIRVQLERLNES